MWILAVFVLLGVVTVKSQQNFGIDQGFCQRTCGCFNPINILLDIPSIPVLRPKRMSPGYGPGFGQPWSPWASSGPQNNLQHPWRPADPFIPLGGSRGRYNKPWTQGAPWLQGSKGMADNDYMPRPDSNANIYKLPKKFVPVETRIDKRLKPSDGFVLMRRHNKSAGSHAYASAGGRKVTGMKGIAVDKARPGMGGGFGSKKGSASNSKPGRPGNKPGQENGKDTYVKKDGKLLKDPLGLNKAGPGKDGAPSNKAGPEQAGGPGNKVGPESEKFIKKDGKVIKDPLAVKN